MQSSIPKKPLKLAAILAFLAAMTVGPALADTLPPLLEIRPEKKFEVLTPIGAGKKTVLEAKEQLQEEGKKVSADAILLLTCEDGGMGHAGLTFYHKDAYCRGLALRYLQP